MSSGRLKKKNKSKSSSSSSGVSADFIKQLSEKSFISANNPVLQNPVNSDGGLDQCLAQLSSVKQELDDAKKESSSDVDGIAAYTWDYEAFLKFVNAVWQGSDLARNRNWFCRNVELFIPGWAMNNNYYGSDPEQGKPMVSFLRGPPGPGNPDSRQQIPFQVPPAVQGNPYYQQQMAMVAPMQYPAAGPDNYDNQQDQPMVAPMQYPAAGPDNYDNQQDQPMVAPMQYPAAGPDNYDNQQDQPMVAPMQYPAAGPDNYDNQQDQPMGAPMQGFPAGGSSNIGDPQGTKAFPVEGAGNESTEQDFEMGGSTYKERVSSFSRNPVRRRKKRASPNPENKLSSKVVNKRLINDFIKSYCG